MWIGVIVFAGGTGLTTLARGRTSCSMHHGAERAGYANGVIARGQQIARAAGPVAAAAIGGAAGYGLVFAGPQLHCFLAAILLTT